MLVHLTAFGGNKPSAQSPWYRHRVWLNTTDRVLEEQLVARRYRHAAGAGTTWRVEKTYRDLKQTIAIVRADRDCSRRYGCSTLGTSARATSSPSSPPHTCGPQ